MAYDFDVLVIGLGPAGMAVSIMAAEMGLKVCAVERKNVGGECMNVGCIPSKALLRVAKARAAFGKLEGMGLGAAVKPEVLRPFARIADNLAYISEKKTMGMFSKVEMLYQEGDAVFVDPHTVAVGKRKITAKRIFICVGSRPEVPDVEGLTEVTPLTNETMFQLERVPASLLVLGSGAIACEMAQAFARLGTVVTMVFRGPGLLWREDTEATAILEKQFAEDGITLAKNAVMRRFSKSEGETILHLEDGQELRAERVLAALGRRFDFSTLALDRAGVVAGNKGIGVDRYLRTSQKHIYACGDCNGYRQFSHAAMHQGMIALMNCMLVWPFKRDFRKYPVPWTVFTEPQLSRVGKSLRQLDIEKICYQTVTVKYDDYGAAIAESVATGFVKAAVSPFGNILGTTVVGEGSGEMINEWTMAMQNRIGMPGILMQQHSFPTMGFLTKRVAETWMTGKMKSSLIKKACRAMFRF